MSDMIKQLQSALGAHKVLYGKQLADRYHHIWKMDEPLAARALVLPDSTEDVSKIMRICDDNDQSVVVHGGLTNLVGGTETTEKDLVISMERMNRIEEIDRDNRTMTVEAGTIIQHIQEAAEQDGMLFPLSFGADGTAQIGGAISTNAGGLRVVRYGMTRRLILGLEVVLADGTLVSSMKKIVKDNSGYDLKQLFIGAEGTLGIVTRAVLKLEESPKSRNSAFIGINEYQKVVELLKFMDRGLAGTMSGFELIWQQSYETLTGPKASVKAPLPPDYAYYVLIESLGADQEKDKKIMETLLEQAMNQGLILDAIMAHSSSDMDWFWTIREDVHVLATYSPFDQHFDVSLPIPYIGTYVENVMSEVSALKEVDACFAFGHVADGNIHFIVGKQNKTASLIDRINDLVYDPLQKMGGSVSAEHGIGNHKKRYLHLCRKPNEILMFKTIKQNLDPKNLLNRGKVIEMYE